MKICGAPVRGRGLFSTIAVAVALIASSPFTASAEGLLINEFLASNNSTYLDEDGAQSDWIEIYNSSASPVDLTDLYLTDDAADLMKWRFPAVTLGAGQYLIVFASDKNRRVPGQPLHTNFKLGANGEYLGLIDGDGFTVIHAYAPLFPEQLSNVSYGISTNETHEARYFSTPTPGVMNTGDYLGVVADTKFSADRGFYSAPFELSVTSTTAGASIRYTLDSSTPTETYGTLYTGPILIDRSTVVRALAYKSGYRSTDVDTQSYIFLSSVLTQPVNPPGFPVNWGGIAGDYEVDPRIVNSPAYSNLMPAALMSLPSISLATHKDNLFSASIGIIANSGGSGSYWERPVSMEWIQADGARDFQLNAGVRVNGGYFRDLGVTRKKTFRVAFKGMYGPTKLNEDVFPEQDDVESYDSITLRAGANDGYNNWGGACVQYTIDEFVRRTLLAMGRPAAHGSFVHLYIDGLYWGLYNTTEHIDASFAASYFGGDKADWDVRSQDEWMDGNGDTWNALISQCQAGVDTEEGYQKLQGNNPDGTRNPAYPILLDVENYIDYMLLNLWIGNADWPGNNWRAMCNRTAAGTGFKFTDWDAELSMISPWTGLWTDMTGAAGGAAEAYSYLRQNAEFRLLFADHVQKFMCTGGVLAAEAVVARFTELSDFVEQAVIAETARWGDQPGGDPNTLETWRAARDNMLVNYLPQRPAVFMQQLLNAGLFPAVEAPAFNQQGGPVSNGFTLVMTAAEPVYYTLDNTDPRERGTGNVTGTLYTVPIPLPISAVVKARARSAGGEWSALNEALFIVPVAAPLEVTEVMYNPRAPEGVETNSGFVADDFEFIELRNTSTNRIGLAGMHFTAGITFDFTGGSVSSLETNAYVLVVRNIQAFTNRYGPVPGTSIAGAFSGSLSDGGEQVTLKDGLNSNVFSFTYSDGRGWPAAADGSGHALVPAVSGGQNDGMLDYGGNWRAGTYRNGSPGIADPSGPAALVINEIIAHTDYTNVLRPEYDSNDAIELYNAGSGPASFSNWYLSDTATSLKKWAITNTGTLPAGGLIVFDEVTGFHNPVTNGFGLNKAGDDVFLSYLPGTAEDRIVDCVQFKAQENERSIGRYPDGGQWWYAMSRTTNAVSKTNTAPLFEVVISEVMYHPGPTPDNPGDNTNDEYIELRNLTNGTIQFVAEGGTWRIGGDVKYVFPAGFSLSNNSYAVLVPFNPTNTTAATQFLNAYGLTNNEVRLVGPYTGKLPNHGGRIALERPLNPDIAGEGISWVIVDEVIYFDRSPWPVGADGTGQPLRRLLVNRSGNNPANWEAGFWSSPGLATPAFRISQPAYGDTVLRGSSVPATAVFDSTVITGTVSGVEFFTNGVSLGVDSTPPYTCVLGPLFSEGKCTLTATLTDTAGPHPARPVVVGISSVNNGIGASEIGISGARLNGAISSNGSADVSIYWGHTDGITNANAWTNIVDLGRKTGSFSEPVIGLLANELYYYRCRATNMYGALWASSSTSFVTRPPQVSLSLEDSPFSEHGDTATVRASLSRLSATNVTVGLQFSGTAAYGSEYSASATSVVITAGQIDGTITLTGLDDPVAEAAKSVIVTMGSLLAGSTGTPSFVTASLTSDDPHVTNTAASGITDSAATVGGTLTLGFDAQAYVFWGTLDGGTNATDWAASNSLGSLAEGPFSNRLSGLTADQTYFFRCYVRNTGGEDWADTSLSFHTGPPLVSIDDTSVIEGNAGTVDTVFQVRLSARSSQNVSVRYATSNGTAVAGADYVTTIGNLIVPAGDAGGQITVPAYGDALDEWPSETFFVNLTTPTNCTIVDAKAAGVIKDDDVAVTLVSWLYRMKIEFTGYRKSETLDDFPALVVFDTNLTNFAYAQLAIPAGQDTQWSSLRFANSNVTALLNYEVERWNTNGRSHVWVQVPELTGSNSFIWAYWGNPAATNTPAFTTNGATWSAGYKGVWHMEAVNTRDATALGHNGTAVGGVGHVITGMVAGADDFDADVDYIAVPDSPDFTLTNDFTISAWINSDAIGNTDEGFVGTYNGSGFMFSLANDTENTLRLWTGGDWRSSDRPIQDAQWTHVAYTRNGTTGRYYVDGVCVRDRGDALTPGDGGELHLGAAGTSWGGNRFDGRLDEVRISTETRSSNWIWACWLNQASNSTFTSCGVVEAADVNMPSFFIVFGATNVTDSSAYITARLTSTGTAPTSVWVLWGPTDGGQTPGGWANTNAMGLVTSKPYIDYTFHATGLQANTSYFYAYRAENSHGTNWASTGFSTVGRPMVDNDGGATNIGLRSASLRGSLLNASPASVTVFRGPVDGGTNALAWATNSHLGTVAGNTAFAADADGMLYGVRYYYRCYATNSYGQDWADTSESFLTTASDASALGVKEGLVLWLDAGDVDGDGNPGNNPANGESVGAWRDRSGMGHDADNLDGSAPVYRAADFNGKTVLGFNGSSYLYTTYDFDTLSGYTIFTMARYSGGDNERVIASRTHNWLFGFWGGTDERWYAEGWVYGGGTGNTNWHMHAGTMTGESDPSSAFWKDGVLLTSGSRGSHDTVCKPGRLGLGGWQGANSEASRCEIAEVLIYDHVLTSNDMDAVGSYLARKYSMTTPYSGRTGAAEIGVSNGDATNVTTSSAQITGTLAASGAVFSVWAHWGDDNAGPGGSWDNSASLGSFTNVPAVDLACDISGLAAETTYYFTFSTHNDAGDSWAEPASQFTTPADLGRWAMRAQATFSGYGSGTNLLNFPALLVLGTNIPGFAYSQFDTADGRDLRFADNNGTMLDYEVESWNPAGRSVVWVRVPQVEGTGTDSIWVLWGNRTAPLLPCRTNGAVWADGYRAVWHMNETAAVDATGRGHNGTPQGTMGITTGVVLTACDFRSSGYITVPSSTDWSFAGDWTWSAWGYIPTADSERGMFGTWGGSFIFAVRSGITRTALNGLNWRWDSGGGSVPPASWHHITCTRNGSTGRFYVDGVQVDSWDATANNSNAGSYPLYIGSGGRDWGGMWNGLMDEVRIEGVARSADWLRACHSNQIPGSTFITYGQAVPYHGIANRPVSGVTATSAVFNALLYTASTGYYVNVYWGPVDGTTNDTLWAFTNAVGFFSGTGMSNISYTAMAGISEFGTNNYAWRVTNSTYSYWAQPSVVWDSSRVWQGNAGDGRWGNSSNWLGENVPDASAEGALFAGAGPGEVKLAGRSYTNSTITFTAGSYSLTDTNAVPGTLSAGSLLNSAGANTIAVGMALTGAAEMSGGTLTLANTTGFSASQLKLSGGALRVNGNVALVNGLTEWWFDGSFDDGYIDPIDSGNGFLNRVPGATSMLNVNLAFDGTAMNTRSGGLVGVDSIGAAWWGKIVIGAGSPLPAGNVTFATASDDGSVFWVDRDQNGRFEHAGALGDEMIVNNKGSHGVNYAYGVVNLAAGTYDVAMGFYEGGGGEYMEARYGSGSLSGNWGALTTINPAAGGQSGLWKSGGVGPVAMTNIPVNAVANSSISAACSTNTAAMGMLTLSNGVTLTTAAGSPIGFLGTVIPAGVTNAGISAIADTFLTMSTGLDGPGTPVTISKTGAGRLVLDRAGSNLDSATFNIRAGSLITVHASALGGGTARLAGGELKLSSPGGDITYANALIVATNSTLTAGKAGGGVAGPLTNTLSGSITFTGAYCLTNRATDNYTLRLGGQISGNGTNVVAAGNVIIDDPCFNAVALTGGSLTVFSNLTVNALLQTAGTFTMAGISRDLVVSNTLTLAGTLNFSGGPNLVLPTATVTLNSGANVTYDKPLAAGTLTINSGGRLNLGTNTLDVGSLTWRNGGTLDMTGTISAATSMSFWPQRTITNKLSGAGGVNIGYNPEDSWGYVELAGTNDYTGMTRIGRGVLRVAENTGLPTNSLLVFTQDNRDEYCILESSGTFSRNIGQNPGEVYWQNMGGFAAIGGDLIVTLEEGAPLDWSSATTGFNNLDSIQFGSPSADKMVELTNPIDLNTDWRRIQVCDNPYVKTDFLRLSGTISGTATWNDQSLRFNENSGNGFYNSLVELTGTNTYSQRTIIDYCALYAIDGVGLSPNSLLYFEGNDVWEEAMLLGNGMFSRRIGHDAPGQVYWGSHGGFAARGGPLTVFLEDGAGLNWGDPNTGFNGQWLQMGSMYADDVVELVNNIYLNGDRYMMVFDNTGTDRDVSRLSGTISGPGNTLRKHGNDVHRAGTLWLSGVNTYSGLTLIDQGAIRAINGIGLPAASELYFEGDAADVPAVLESNGTFTRNIDNSPGCVFWGSHGGFAAWGGPFIVNLEGGSELQFDSDVTGFRDQWLHLGSRTANNVVELRNAINLNANWRNIAAFDNPYSTNDYSVLSGTLRNGYLQIRGDGVLKLTGTNSLNYLGLYGNGLTVLFNGIHTGIEWVWAEANYTSTLGGCGTISSPNFQIRSPGNLAPGDGVGVLTTVISGGDGFYMLSGSTYKWELGPGSCDRLAQTGNLRLDSGWKLKLLSAGGTPRATEEYVLFTYSGTCSYSAPALDASSMPADWVTNGVSVVHDTVGKRIYLTGLYSLLSVANDPPTDLTSTSATLNGVVSAMADPLYVSVYWSTNNAGTNAAAWLETGFAADKGYWSSVIGQAVSHPVTGLNTNILYYYAFHATNSTGSTDLWATPAMSFRTLAPPVVSNAGAAAGIGYATLSGYLAYTGGAPTTVSTYWGETDCGTDKMAWGPPLDNGIPGVGLFSADTTPTLIYGKRYYYRTYATNLAGDAWAPSTGSFYSRNPLSKENRLKISFTNYAGGTLTNFPALVKLGTGISNFTYRSFLSNKGYDLRFRNGADTTNLNYEIEQWNTNGESTVWVQVQTFTSNCFIWAVWGDPAATNQPAYTTNGLTFSDGFVGVWHLADTVTDESTAGTYRDSSTNHNPGAQYYTATGTGLAGPCGDFDGNDYVIIDDKPYYNNTDFVTASIWVKCQPTGWYQDWQMFVTKGNDSFWDLRRYGGSDQISFCLNNWNQSGGATNVQDGSWHQIVGTYSQSPLVANIYLDGHLYASFTPPDQLNDTTGTPLEISGRTYGSYTHRGLMDELRVSRACRSADWIRAEYDTIASHSAFTSYGEAVLGAGNSDIAITNLAPANITISAATFRAALNASQAVYHVSVFWGTSNGTTNASAWAYSNWVGTYSGVATNLSFTPGTYLSPTTGYYYAFAASNAVTNLWAVPSQWFATLNDDIDADGLPDTWEDYMFKGTNVTSGSPDQDWDGDGASDRDEFTAGTIATNRQSCFRLQSRVSNSVVVVQFEGLEAAGPGYEGRERRYDLEQAAGLPDGQWAAVPGRTNLLGEGKTITHTNYTGPSVFFRGKVWLQ